MRSTNTSQPPESAATDFLVADCLSRIASSLGYGVTPARFLSLIEISDEDVSPVVQTSGAWLAQFPSGRCSEVDPETVSADILPLIAIEDITSLPFIVREVRGSSPVAAVERSTRASKAVAIVLVW